MSSIKIVNHDCCTGCKCSSLLKFVLVMQAWPFCPSRTDDFLWYVFSLAPISCNFPQSSRVPRVLCLSRIKPIYPRLFYVTENSFSCLKLARKKIFVWISDDISCMIRMYQQTQRDAALDGIPIAIEDPPRLKHNSLRGRSGVGASLSQPSSMCLGSRQEVTNDVGRINSGPYTLYKR
jgi:hypothetical protein